MEKSKVIDFLRKETPFGIHALLQIIDSSPFRYKSHFINKRNNRGKRLISQPTREVKLLQKLMVKFLMPLVEVHDSATAYRSGKSIVDHAAPHAKNKYLLKLDFKDFFPSIDRFCLKHCFDKIKEFSDLECAQIIKILCKADSDDGEVLTLSIGAPSSPFISNFVMHEFDEILQKYCNENNAIYTRYADDIAISSSTPRFLDDAYVFVERVLKDLNYLKLKLNEDKTVNTSKKNKRFLVGLVLSNSGVASIGREKKRDIRAALHNASKGFLTSSDLNNLRGKLSYYYGVDRDFVLNLIQKYGFTRPNQIVFPVKDAVEIEKQSQQTKFDDGDEQIPF